jgi:ribosome-binding factor A
VYTLFLPEIKQAEKMRSKVSRALLDISALGYIKRVLAAKLGLRYMPDLQFFYDESFDYGSHIDNMLKLIKADDESDNTTIEK